MISRVLSSSLPNDSCLSQNAKYIYPLLKFTSVSSYIWFVSLTDSKVQNFIHLLSTQSLKCKSCPDADEVPGYNPLNITLGTQFLSFWNCETSDDLLAPTTPNTWCWNTDRTTVYRYSCSNRKKEWKKEPVESKAILKYTQANEFLDSVSKPGNNSLSQFHSMNLPSFFIKDRVNLQLSSSIVLLPNRIWEFKSLYLVLSPCQSNVALFHAK